MKIRWFAPAVLFAVVFSVATAYAQESTPFQGHWVGTDGFDGSRNTLTVGGGNLHTVYSESGVTACLSAFGEFSGGSVEGFATIDGNSLTFIGTLYCDLESGSVAHPYFDGFVWVVSYDPSTDSVSLDADPYTTMFRPQG
jgi:hypothetical protein